MPRGEYITNLPAGLESRSAEKFERRSLGMDKKLLVEDLVQTLVLLLVLVAAVVLGIIVLVH